ncbi:hypothetical protein MOOR_21500 [Moorella thermoacetica]|uniref:Uncharacterized protein n=2 Tax=Neomoorella thermoacetica TaxID=1525 RepID=A0A1J5JF75_NEOTH|nr:hypothetical protein MOOR_21500 [Moorella thermoacetica]
MNETTTSHGVNMVAVMQHSVLEEELRAAIVAHLRILGIKNLGRNGEPPVLTKDAIRAMHAMQRQELLERERSVLSPRLSRLIQHFAEGREIDPKHINPELVPVRAEDKTGLLFRLATLLWSVPVSRGFGRRMRFLVRDRFNGKLIGIFALGDPVFNLRARDSWIGWTVADRKLRLANVMDAYVVGAVPPYSKLLGGKLVCSLIGSAEVADSFAAKYAGRRGVISGQVKSNKLALVTVTSALGRSSLYNRLRLPGLIELVRVGTTQGWGHFHVPGRIFEAMRHLLELYGHPYAKGYKYGNGPNWRMRVVRAALKQLGMDQDLLRHGVTREVYVMPLAQNWREFLQGKTQECTVNRPSVEEIAAACRERWIIPRSQRFPDYVRWTREDTLGLFGLLR